MSDNQIFFIKNGFYDDMKKSRLEESYILDSNIVLKMRDLYYNPSSFSDHEFESMMNLLDRIKGKVILPHIAIQELSWDYENFRIDKTKFLRIEEAITKIITESETIKRIKSKQKYVSEISAQQGGKKRLDSLYENCKENNYLLPTMCILLKFQLLLKEHSPKTEKQQIYFRIASFMNNEVGMVGAYEMLLIQDILFYKDEKKVSEIKSLLKLNSKERDIKKSLWNSAWDILYMRTIFAFVTDYLRGTVPTTRISNPVLVTKDENLSILSKYYNDNIEITKVDSKLYPGLKSIHEDQEANAIILAVQLALGATAQQRVAQNNKYSLQERVERLTVLFRTLEEQFSNIE